MRALLCLGLLLVGAAATGVAAGPPAGGYPAWLENDRADKRFYRRGAYNFAVYGLKPLARDLNGVAVGHALAYEDLVTGKAAGLETRTYARIRAILANPPALMPDEAALSPTFGRRYGVLEQVFDWTHVLHAQTMDVLLSRKLSQAEKDREMVRLWEFYQRAPYAVTGLPLSMAYLDAQPYSGAFRRKYPKVNGLFWGYHWLQGTMYDAFYRVPPAEHAAGYALVGRRYHDVELHRTDRPFMPMAAETSPRFAQRFPEIANAFDNLHMLHDLVNDILATETFTEARRQEEIRRAIWLVSAAAHRGEQPVDAAEPASADPWHDHRHFAGMPGMGMMTGMTRDLMWMPEMGWMHMGDCHHCTMPLWEGKDAWRNPTVSAEGWSMRVRCALCARDMAAETKGSAILRLPTEDPDQLLIVYSDEQGNLRSSSPGALFLEEEASHAGCEHWSRAFTGRPAFDAFVAANPAFKTARPLTFTEWAERAGEKPDTYTKPVGPSANPYAGAEGRR
jgi:hypothetical protein